MNKTLRKAMLSTVSMLVVGVMALTGVTYAWFTQGTDATVTAFDVNVQAADGSLTLAMPNADGALTWGTSITPGAPANALRPVSNKSGTTDKFFHATVSSTDATKLGTVTALNAAVYTTGEGESAVSYNNWYSFDFFINNMTNTKEMTVTLKDVEGFTGNSAKALRIAFIQNGYMTDASGAFNDADNYAQGETEQKVVIFEPNSSNNDDDHSAQAQANKAVNGGYMTYAITETGATGSAIYGTAGNGKAQQSTFDDTTTAVATLPANTVAKISVVVWLEGQDVDCNNDIAAITMKLPIALQAAFA